MNGSQVRPLHSITLTGNTAEDVRTLIETGAASLQLRELAFTLTENASYARPEAARALNDAAKACQRAADILDRQAGLSLPTEPEFNLKPGEWDDEYIEVVTQ